MEETVKAIEQDELEDLIGTVAPNNRKKRLRRKLMFSEWLVKKPHDFEENWMVKLCPAGKHHLVVARGKNTNAYNKYGALIQTFKSCLPGGNKKTKDNVFTVLDCIFHPQKKCYFVIDLLAWNGISFRDSDVECRYFWLQSKFEENQTLNLTSKDNEYPFYKVETFTASQLRNQLGNPYQTEAHDKLKLDGILFYLKDKPYKMRITPNVGWLKPFMVKEILEIDVHESFQAPSDYTGIKDYLAKSKERRNQIRQKKLQKPPG